MQTALSLINQAKARSLGRTGSVRDGTGGTADGNQSIDKTEKTGVEEIRICHNEINTGNGGAMDITVANLTVEDRRKLEYIQQQTNRDLQASLSFAIDAYYQTLHQSSDPLARLKKSPLIASFKGDADLAEQSEEIFHALIEKDS